jgi:two-component system alkaline phosphatase synthesis response regulator PhoP
VEYNMSDSTYVKNYQLKKIVSKGVPLAKKILVVDDKKEIRTLLKQYLSQEGFEIATAADGQEALFLARQGKPDLIILDLMMPEMGGYEFMRVYNRESNTPIIIVTAKLEENDKVLGLELGADDYITKPFSMRELTARVHAVLRRMEHQTKTSDTLKASDITVDLSGRMVLVKGKQIDLTPTEFDLLATLISTPGRTFTRLELLDHLQGNAFEGYIRTIDVHIRNLRAKIEADTSNPLYIQTVYGIGYRFASQINP